MGHDMSDPGMAAAMERDMRNRFFVALLLTIPTVLYSPLGMNLLGLRLPTFGLGENVIMLLLSTPVVFYCGLDLHLGLLPLAAAAARST